MQYISGIVEGFYGRQWSAQARLDYADYLVEQGLNSYLYCPKGDAFLRKQWQQDWPRNTYLEQQRLATHYRERQLNWGVGLSPYALYQEYGEAEKVQLRSKISEIDALGGNTLAILFDDMPGDCPDLALRQAQILCDVQNWSEAEILLTCPTYYSFDPVLERFFGARPQDYWQQFGAAVPNEFGIFWCGNQVCSEAIGGADITAISELLGRAPVLWDNYPVNDGARASNFLHITPLAHREPVLRELTAGHLCNPMNQAYLSMAPLTGLATLLSDRHSSIDTPQDYPGLPTASSLALARLGVELAPAVAEDLYSFERIGLDAMATEEVQRLQQKYRQIAHPAAAEIADWLAGGYTFDPACLTG